MSSEAALQPTTPHFQLPSKRTAFLIHLALSILVFASLIAVMMIWWFPGELFWIDGGFEGLKLVAMVDLVLGPALTLLLYKPGKRGLALDMSLIAFIQLSALCYGFVVTWQQRTVALVFAERAFTTVSWKAHSEANQQLLELDRTPRQISDLASGRPPLLVTPAPEKGAFGSHLADILNGFPEPHERSDQYVSVENGQRDLDAGRLDMDDVAAMGLSELVSEALATHRAATSTQDAGNNDNDTALELYRFKGRFARGVALLDREQQRIVDFIPRNTQRRAAASANADGGE